MNDLGKDWELLMGTPTLVSTTAGTLRTQQVGNRAVPIQKIGNKTVEKCVLCIEGARLVVSDAKGKKVHLTMDLASVKDAKLAQLSFMWGSNTQWPKQVTKYFAVVSCADGKTYSFGQAKDESDFHQTELIAAINNAKGG